MKKKQTNISDFFKPHNREAPIAPSAPTAPISDVSVHNPNLLICFTDGSTFNNGAADAKGGYAVVWPDHEEFDYAEFMQPATNNRCEYSAVIHAIRQADILDPERKKTLLIYTDSMLLINSLTKWLHGWKKNGYKKADGKTILNLDLVKILEELISLRKTSFKHVRAHTGKTDWMSIYNDKVDKMARNAALARR